MPMLKRSVEPHHVCRTEIPECIEIELECVNNATLSAIIRQLSSLSKHAEDIFAELFQEASVFYLRTVSLQDRIDRLAAKVTQLDSSVEEVSLQDIHLRKAFHSCTAQDQHLVSKASIPTPITQMYRRSDKPPPLGALTQYREDGVDALKLYSDPSYFFDLWKERMMLATEEKRRERRRQREQKRGMHGTLPREVKRVRKVRDRREEWNRPPFPDFPATQPIMTNHRPPQPSLTNQHPPPPQRVEHEYHSIAAVAMAPPPAPPPVPPLPTGIGMVTSDARSDLLAAIRVGIQLKKVQEQKELRAKRQPIGNDVAAILSRRIAVEMSDSEEGEESDGEGGEGLVGLRG
ncbi:hypothetical protein AALO_G00031430 [Alosa alosa]|uniref:Wiskott-Aldrich syndrome protein family member n=1 Tax=Alosa alosa TaxID=278164 RepID=A0AAV6HG61_9TELE|nr:hypothetical protein AALO_G00031430 [Alosa alosa]